MTNASRSKEVVLMINCCRNILSEIICYYLIQKPLWYNKGKLTKADSFERLPLIFGIIVCNGPSGSDHSNIELKKSKGEVESTHIALITINIYVVLLTCDFICPLVYLLFLIFIGV